MSAVKRLQAVLDSSRYDALFVSDLTNVQWLTDFTGSAGTVVVTPDTAVFLTDSRYTIQANEQVKGLEVRWHQNPKTGEELLDETLKDLGIKRLGYETSMTVARHNRLTEKLPDYQWVDSFDAVRPLRMVKTPDEVAKIEAACKLADQCMNHVQRMMSVGVAEFDIGMDIEFFYRRQGAVISFDPIVASGPNSARPHARPSERKLQYGDFVTIDMGAKLEGYCSDITRTFVIGEASERHKEVYNQVLRAEVECCNLCVKGAAGKEVDAHARAILAEKDLAKYFGHGLGHGLGRDVHDFGGLSPSSTDVLEPGNVYTIEPGVYIEGFGGVRIEDDVLVTDGGPRILTHFPKELTVVG